MSTRRYIALSALLGAALACQDTTQDAPVTTPAGSGAASEAVPVPPGASVTDLALRAAVLGQFAADPAIDATRYSATVVEGVVTLTSDDDDALAWARARDLAALVEGVEQVLMSTPAPPAGGSGAQAEPPSTQDLEAVYAYAAALGTTRDEPLALDAPGEGSGDTIALAASGDRPRTYVVQGGDNLSLIASKTLGDGLAWERIYELNRSTIGPNPQALQAGMELRIPQD